MPSYLNKNLSPNAVISLSSSSPGVEDKNEEEKQVILPKPASATENVVRYTDLDLVPAPEPWERKNISNKNAGMKLEEGGRKIIPEIKVRSALVRGCCADCGCSGVKDLNDPPFSPKYEPQDYPTPLSEVAPQKSALDLGDSKKISKSAK